MNNKPLLVFALSNRPDRKGLKPVLPESIMSALIDLADSIHESVTKLVERYLPESFTGRDPRRRRILALAVAGDIVTTPIPSPLDAPFEVVIERKLRAELPEMPSYRRSLMKMIERIPILELLPTYTIATRLTLEQMEKSRVRTS